MREVKGGGGGGEYGSRFTGKKTVISHFMGYKTVISRFTKNIEIYNSLLSCLALYKAPFTLVS